MPNATQQRKSHELRNERMTLITQARGITDRMAETRSAKAEDKAEVDRIMGRVSDLDVLIEAVERVETAHEADPFAETRRRTQPFNPTPGNAGGDGGSILDRPEYRAAFRNFLRDGRFDPGPEFRDVTMSPNTSGGYLVTPTQVSRDVVQIINNLVFVRQLAEVETITEAQSLGVRQITTQPSDASWTTEIGNIAADTAMAFGRRDLFPNLIAKGITLSMRLMNVSRDVEKITNERLAYKNAVAEENAFLNGSGSGQPLGVFTASSNGIPTSQDYVVTASSSTTILADNLAAARYQLKQPYLASKSAAWCFSRPVVQAIRLLKDQYGRYLWVNGGGFETAPDTLDGIPVRISEYAPSTFTAGAYIGILGNWSYYRIADVDQMHIQRLVELYAATSEVGFISRRWVDGAPVLGEAFVRLQIHA